jgi:hypothetical protein
MSPVSASPKDKPVGTQLVSDLINSDKVTTVTATDHGNATIAVNVENATNGVGSGSTVEYNQASAGSGIVNTDGSTRRSQQVGLGHELVQARDNTRGTRNDKPSSNTDPDTGK